MKRYRAMRLALPLVLLIVLSVVPTLARAGVLSQPATSPQPFLVKAGAQPSQLTDVNGMLFFAGVDPANQHAALWKSDGTSGGTTIVRSFTNFISTSVASPDTGVAELTNLNGTLFFVATDQSAGRQLWRSDGTAAGTRVVKSITPVGAEQGPAGLHAMGTFITFIVYNGTNWQLWRSDGTDAGTRPLATLDNVTLPPPQANIGGTLLFAAGCSLWASDGTTAGTRVLKPGLCPDGLLASGGIIYFSASDTAHGRELWRSDGTAAGTTLVKDIVPGPGDSNPSLRVRVDVQGTLFFIVDKQGLGNLEIWKSDGIAANTVEVTPLDTANGECRSEWVVRAPWIFYATNQAATGCELWKTDGTTAGTQLVDDVAPGAASSYPLPLANLSGSLLFVTTSNGVLPVELRKSRGTAANTTSLGPTSLFWNEPRLVGPLLYFTSQGDLWAIPASVGWSNPVFLPALWR